MLATLLPALLSGVSMVLAARIVTPESSGVVVRSWPDSLLAGLELAGQEVAPVLSPGEARQLAAELFSRSVRGAVAVVSDAPAGESVGSLAWELFAQGARLWRSPAGGGIRLWNDSGLDWDVDALTFAHPDAAISVWGRPLKDRPASWTFAEGDFAAFVSGRPMALFAPDALLEQCLAGAPLALGPGHEGCWLWPDLEPAFFWRRCAAWEDDESPAANQRSW